MTMPIADSSSSAWMMAKLLSPVSGSTRSCSQNILNPSISDVDGVIGYQAPKVAPAYTQPSAAAVLPSIMMWLAVLSDASMRKGRGVS